MRGLPTERVEHADPRCGRLIAYEDDRGKLVIGVLGEVAADVINALLAEEASPSDEFELDLSRRRGGFIPTGARHRLRQSTEIGHQFALSEDEEMQVFRSALCRHGENELREEV
jgi:hypothetical protein